ncbi:MAG: acetate--CoA ligase family protein [Methanomicrobiaceae archaeon]|nr:acetate--CoA ligase family protein [Methanomicrobiaceae archaeon]
MLTEPEGYALLSEAGIPVPAYRVVSDAGSAAAAANAIGYPVVMKVVSPDIVHKSDAGGVVTGITDEAGARAAYTAILGNVSAAFPDARVDGVIVEEQVAAGLELIVGGTTDPAFGKVITFGLGGTLVELVRDVAIRVLPIDDDERADMVRSIRGYPLIAGFRGQAPRDEAALLDAIEKISSFFLARDDLSEFDINPLVLYEKGVCAVDARIIPGTCDTPACGTEEKAATDTSLFYPSSIALVGASQNPNKIGYAIFRNLLSFDGRVYPVNPNATELFGRTVYPSLSDLPERVDMVLVAVPAPLVPAVIAEAGEQGVKIAVIISAGFRETGKAGEKLEDEVMAAARKYGVRVLGPNCLGIMLPHRGLNATFEPSSPRPGPIAFISQSGAVITTVVDWSLIEEIGISAVISVGNQADLEFEDFMQFAADDPDTKTVILYIEEIKNGRRFLEFSRALSGKKPIVVIKSGSSEKGRKAASSHTGSLAGSYAVYQAAFCQAGVIAVHSLREAFEVAGLLASEGYPRGPRAAVITSAGGFAVLSSDYAEENGIRLIEFSGAVMAELNALLPSAWSHGNPLDMVGDAGVDRYARVFDVMIRHQDEWDVCFVITVPSVTIDPTHLAKEIIRFSMNTRKVIVGCLLGGESMRAGIRILRNAHIPNFSEPEDAFRTVGTALDRKSWGEKPDSVSPGEG